MVFIPITGIIFAMAEETVIEALLARREEIRGKGVRRLTLFGPEARGENRPGGEVHLLVELEAPVSFEHFLEVRDFLSGLLKRPVELVIEKVDHPQIWAYVKEDAVKIVGL